MTEPYRAWRERVFGPGYEVWHEGGPNTEVTTRTWLADRAGTERMLCAGLALDDHAVPVAIGDFAAAGHTPGPEVMVALVAATGHDRPLKLRIAALRACWVVTRDPVWVDRLVQRLQDRRRLVGRGRGAAAQASAATWLRDVPPTEPVLDALVGAVRHGPTYLVRYHAAGALIALAGGNPDGGMTPVIIDTLAGRTTWRARRSLARELRAAVGEHGAAG